MSKSECLKNSPMSNDKMMKSFFDGIHSKAILSDFEHSSLGIRHDRQDPESTWRCRTNRHQTNKAVAGLQFLLARLTAFQQNRRAGGVSPCWMHQQAHACRSPEVLSVCIKRHLNACETAVAVCSSSDDEPRDTVPENAGSRVPRPR